MSSWFWSNIAHGCSWMFIPKPKIPIPIVPPPNQKLFVYQVFMWFTQQQTPWVLTSIKPANLLVKSCSIANSVGTLEYDSPTFGVKSPLRYVLGRVLTRSRADSHQYTAGVQGWCHRFGTPADLGDGGATLRWSQLQPSMIAMAMVDVMKSDLI